MSYKTQGTCSKMINIELEGDIIKKVEFIGGCPGNVIGLAKLSEGRSAEDIIKRVEGVTCGFKPTSCPDQLAKALRMALAEQAQA
ncbi:MAG: TIGR03905 family TSCPD domain-containing protein [Oscillospiraceae bacterium]|nr:TIGR03905 family TSCPD domain-containing protein [Oscillospiraceae bacterium]